MARVALNLSEDIQPVSDFRANASGMIKQARASGRPIVLTQRGRGTAVLLDIDVYESLLDEVAELRSVCSALGDAAAGRVVPHEEVKADILRRLE